MALPYFRTISKRTSDMKEICVDEFIAEMKERPNLWDVNHVDYMNVCRKKDAWEEMVEIFIGKEDATAEERNNFESYIRRRWKSLRNCYSRELKIRRNKTRENSRNPRGEYIFFKQLSFLNGSMQSEPEDESSEVTHSPQISQQNEQDPVCDGKESQNISKIVEKMPKNQMDCNSKKGITIFLDLLKKYPCLWNTGLEEYVDVRQRENAFKKFIEDLTLAGFNGITRQVIKKRMKNLRDTYKRELNRVYRTDAMGGGVYQPRLSWFKQADSLWRFPNPYLDGKDLRESSKEIELMELELETEHVGDDDYEPSLSSASEFNPCSPDEYIEPQSQCNVDPLADPSDDLKPSRRSDRLKWEHQPYESAISFVESIHTNSEPDQYDNFEQQVGTATMNLADPLEDLEPPRVKRLKRKHHTYESESSVDQPINTNKELDQYDHFAKHLATQMRELPLRSFIIIQNKFQSILTEERLANLTMK